MPVCSAFRMRILIKKGGAVTPPQTCRARHAPRPAPDAAHGTRPARPARGTRVHRARSLPDLKIRPTERQPSLSPRPWKMSRISSLKCPKRRKETLRESVSLPRNPRHAAPTETSAARRARKRQCSERLRAATAPRMVNGARCNTPCRTPALDARRSRCALSP